MIDITAVTQLNDFLSQWIEGEGQPFIYMPRYNRSYAPFGQCTRCVDVSEKTITDRRCPDCFLPGTLVRTKRGYTPIEEIKIGDYVLSKYGKFQKVLALIKKDFKGDVINISSPTLPVAIKATPDHKFMSLQNLHSNMYCRPGYCMPLVNAQTKWLDSVKGIRKLPSGNFWIRVTDPLIQRSRHTLGTYSSNIAAIEAVKTYKRNNMQLLHKTVWREIKDIHEEGWIQNNFCTEVEDVHEVKIPKQFLGKYKNRLGSKKFIVDKDFLWVLGLYIAEGSSSKRTINFALHRDEIKFQKRLLKVFTKWGYHPRIRAHNSINGISVDINSTTLAQFFPYYMGHLCYNKHIPYELMQLPKEKIRHIIRGIWDGDGTKDTNEIGQTSLILSLQLVELLERLDQQPTVYQMTQYPDSTKLPAWMVSWREKTATRVNRKGRWKLDSKYYNKIHKTYEYYEGPVYTLTVDKTHAYTVQNLLAKNCFGTGFNGGYGAPITGINSTFQRCYGFTSTDKITTDIQRSGIQVVNQNQVLYIKMLQQPAWGDLIIRDRDNVRFKVGNEFDYWSFNGLSLGYVITVFQVQDDDPAYLVPVPSLVTMQGRTSNASLQMQIEQMYSLTTSITPST